MKNTPEDPSVDAFDQLQSLLITLVDVDSFVQSLAELAADVVDPSASCGVVVRVDGRPLAVGSSDGRAGGLVQVQLDLGDGPGLHALRTGEPVHVVDTAHEQRWEPYNAVARQEGVRSSLSLPMSVRGSTVGAMDFFAFHAAYAFDAEQRRRCNTFVTRATGTLQLATRHLNDATLLQQLEEAMTSRTVIDQALGILIAQLRCTAETAFTHLSQQASSTNQKLRDVAADLVYRVSGTVPSDGKPFDTNRRRPSTAA